MPSRVSFFDSSSTEPATVAGHDRARVAEGRRGWCRHHGSPPGECPAREPLRLPLFSMKKKNKTRNSMERSHRLELLPEDVLVKILCKVNHTDLKQLLLVSKGVHGATLIAKEMHFAFSTPASKPVFGSERRMGDADFEVGEEAPKRQRAAKLREDIKTLSSIAVVLFTSPEKQWPKNGLSAEM